MPRTIVDLPARRPPTAADPIAVAIRKPPRDSVIPYHAHAWGQLAFPVSGALCLDVPGSRWLVPPYRAVWVPPGIPHEVLLLGKVEMHTVHVAAELAPLPPAQCTVIEIGPLARELISALAASPPPSGEHLRQIQALLLTELAHARTLDLRLPQPADRRLRALCEALMDDPADTAPLEEWAQRVGASARTLARLFQAEMGMSFGLWRQQVRLNRATVLAAQGRPYAEIAAELGYASPSAFSAMFRRAYGMSPRRFFGGQPA
ncbi:helix-turn-helix domain-containing protein [Azoarcus indigens]|uniref:AraC family transcriptional regulator n=1 Tax=Azoarcus indigens TaxID=29545 RepID=A0A4R6E1L8_9RHOO|nr:helix-turn-helix transcriptional regulator [Azoarcus indigens]NMG64706.1 helix-turn-helix domain-containing protein [Azoarcus indigens]TDN50909.1 AraC family transcriptional regulator [Azoarcus indigens]